MHYFTFAEKDTTLYQASGSLNAGLDEILEIRKEVSDTGATVNVSRILMRFNLNYISSSIVRNTITNPSFYLNLYDAKSTELATSQSLYAYPVQGAWVAGDGRSYDNPITDEGASWYYKDGQTDGTVWHSEVSSSGGTWYSGSGYEASHSFSHTKYPPTLETVWNDSKWSTGSLSPLTGSALEDSLIYMKGLRPEYKEKSKVRFRLVGRERFPAKTYSTTPSNLTVKTLPSASSFYSIRDAETHDVIVPYGSGSLVSCDSNGNYFNLWLDGYQPERYYTIEYRVQSGSGTIEELDQYFDEGFTFKVTL